MNSKLHLKRKLERSISYAHKKIILNTTILDKMFVKKYEKSSKTGWDQKTLITAFLLDFDH